MDSKILVGPFQLKIFYYSVKLNVYAYTYTTFLFLVASLAIPQHASNVKPSS